MKIKWKPRHNKREKDCWVDALAFATGKTYEEIDELFEKFKDDEGGLGNTFIKAFLFKNDFEEFGWDAPNRETIKRVIQFYNTHDNYCVFCIYHENAEDTSHAFYVTDNTIYDNAPIEERSEWIKQKVKWIMMKAKDL